MKAELKRQVIFGSVFLYANKLQVIGDRMESEVTMKQWLLIIMAAQFENAPTLTELGEFMGCSRQNVKKLAVKLEKKSLIKLTGDEHDARILRVVLTEKCWIYYRERGQREAKYLDALFNGLSDNEVDTLGSLFYKFGENIFKMYASAGAESSQAGCDCE